ncbi:MAG: methyl-accepting chemotaxis protein [Betaproteobacteria bacterium]|nr:methyl-accepting chemotaxis protein [Betaproteobacteria bacterium]
MLKNLRLGTRLGLGFGIVVLIFAGVAAMIYLDLVGIDNSAERVRNIILPKAACVNSMKDSMFQMRLGTLRVTANQGDRSGDAEIILKHRKDLLATSEEFDKLLKLISFDQENTAVKRIKENLAHLTPLQDQLINRSSADETITVAAAAKDAGAIIADLVELSKFEDGRTMARSKEIADQVRSSEFTLIIAIVVALVVVIAIAVLVTRSITKPVAGMVETVETMAGGDFSRAIVAESKDEVGALQAALGRMSDNLARMIGEVRDGAKQLVSSSGELSGSTEDVRRGSESQSEAASAMAAALEQMSTSISHVASLSEDARKTSFEAGETASSGSGTIREMVDEIRQMAEAVGEGATRSQQLGKESERISAIVYVIRDVADQTNLLALNAAIEAARAGEQGRGFAVVADEVRKLAEKTTASAQEITEMVGSIQNGASAMSTQMETTSQRMQEGMELAKKAGGAIDEINSGAQSVVRMIDDVSTALKEQASASHDIAGRVEQIVQMIEENSNAVGGAAEIVHQLNELAESLRKGVDRFRVSAH